MLKQKEIKTVVSLFIIALYTFVFAFSPYLHEHHEQKSKVEIEKVSSDKSCDLCKNEPVKTFTAEAFELVFTTQVVYNPFEIKLNSYHPVSAKLFPNKAPPVEA